MIHSDTNMLSVLKKVLFPKNIPIVLFVYQLAF